MGQYICRCAFVGGRGYSRDSIPSLSQLSKTDHGGGSGSRSPLGSIIVIAGAGSTCGEGMGGRAAAEVERIDTDAEGMSVSLLDQRI